MTRTNCLLYSLHACILAVLLGCNNETAADRPTADSATPVVDSIATGQDTAQTIHDPDTTTFPPEPDTADLHPVIRPVPAKSATLGYSYFQEMSRGETKDINVYVSVKNPSSRVRDTLKVIVQEQNPKPSSAHDTTVIYTVNVIVYEALDISLIDPAGDFSITAIHPSDRQLIDTVDGNRWRWTITTNTDKKSARLILKVIAEKPGGIRDRFDDKTIPIIVKIDGNIVRRFFNYLTDNPKVSIPILVGLFGFVGWWIRYKVEKKKKS